MALSTRLRCEIFAWLAATLLVVCPASAQKSIPSSILAAAADYMAQYEQGVVAGVAQEDYRQRVYSATRPTRQLRSDLVMIADANRGWIEFRDVFEVDGRAVRDHDDRLAELFLKPNPNARQQAARIVEESARFNLNPPGISFERTLNIPLEALRFLRKMEEEYNLEDRTTSLSGDATYSNFRRFRVDVSTDIKSGRQ